MPGTMKMFCIRMTIFPIGITLNCSWHATWPPCKTSILDTMLDIKWGGGEGGGTDCTYVWSPW